MIMKSFLCKVNRGVGMYQRTAPQNPNGQIDANLTAGPTDYEAGYFPAEFYFSDISRWDSRRVWDEPNVYT